MQEEQIAAQKKRGFLVGKKSVRFRVHCPLLWERPVSEFLSLWCMKERIKPDPQFLALPSGGLPGLGRRVLPRRRYSRVGSLHSASCSTSRPHGANAASGQAGRQWTMNALNCHLFPGFMNSNMGRCQSPRLSGCCLPIPHPQPPHVLSCPSLVKYLRKHMTKLWQIQ